MKTKLTLAARSVFWLASRLAGVFPLSVRSFHF
jgi:hypothetical protein